jgi:hypothetical protein
MWRTADISFLVSCASDDEQIAGQAICALARRLQHSAGRNFACHILA